MQVLKSDLTGCYFDLDCSLLWLNQGTASRSMPTPTLRRTSLRCAAMLSVGPGCRASHTLTLQSPLQLTKTSACAGFLRAHRHLHQT